MKAYCYRTGHIIFTSGKVPDGALHIGTAPARVLREKVGMLARHSYPTKRGGKDSVLLVPGIPEAKNETEAFAAFEQFSKNVADRLEVKPLIGRVIIIQSGHPGADTKMFRAYLPANPGGVRKPVGVSCSTTGNEQYAIIRCAAKAFQKLNGGDVDEIETRVKIEKHPQPGTWLAEVKP